MPLLPNKSGIWLPAAETGIRGRLVGEEKVFIKVLYYVGEVGSPQLQVPFFCVTQKKNICSPKD